MAPACGLTHDGSTGDAASDGSTGDAASDRAPGLQNTPSSVIPTPAHELRTVV